MHRILIEARPFVTLIDTAIVYSLRIFNLNKHLCTEPGLSCNIEHVVHNNWLCIKVILILKKRYKKLIIQASNKYYDYGLRI